MVVVSVMEKLALYFIGFLLHHPALSINYTGICKSCSCVNKSLFTSWEMGLQTEFHDLFKLEGLPEALFLKSFTDRSSLRGSTMDYRKSWWKFSDVLLLTLLLWEEDFNAF